MLTDDDWKDEKKEYIVLIIIFPTCYNLSFLDFFTRILIGQAKLLKGV